MASRVRKGGAARRRTDDGGQDQSRASSREAALLFADGAGHHNLRLGIDLLAWVLAMTFG
jgi:hypothetical protein